MSDETPTGSGGALRRPWSLLLLAVLVAAGYFMHSRLPPPPRQVRPVAETGPVRSKGDAADDPAIWVDRERPERSLILGTDKDSGLHVFDLDGRELQFLGERALNNVDLIEDVVLAGERMILVAAGDQSAEEIVFFRLDPEARRLEPLPFTIHAGTDPEGICLYRQSRSGRVFVFAVGDMLVGDDDRNMVEQWELVPGADGVVEGRLVRSFELESESEGCVVDEHFDRLYVAEEHAGIWCYPADPLTSFEPRLVARIGPLSPLSRDVEGLAIHDAGDGRGFLVASCQGDDAFVLFRRDDLGFAGRFQVTSSRGIDAVTHTDGVALTSRPLGPRFPKGLFVVQDDDNEGGLQNFKLVSWADVEAALGLDR